MFVGTYWTQRKESRQVSAERTSLFLQSIGSELASLSTWFLKGRSRARARVRLSIDTASIMEALVANRRDASGDVLIEAGFNLGIWNGDDASFAVTIGAFSPYVRNSAVLSFNNRGAQWCNSVTSRQLLSAAVQAFDPDHGVVSTNRLLAQAENAWDVGWLTYERAVGFSEHRVS